MAGSGQRKRENQTPCRAGSPTGGKKSTQGVFCLKGHLEFFLLYRKKEEKERKEKRKEERKGKERKEKKKRKGKGREEKKRKEKEKKRKNEKQKSTQTDN